MNATVIPFRRPSASVTAPAPAIDPVALTFDAGGLLARQGRELRAGQRALAAAIHGALTRGEGLLAEGPCGTGKSLAYLVPAIHHAVTMGRKVVVATAGIALQEQLVTKDLPYLQTLLPWRFDFALQKGVGNYLCHYRRDHCDGYPETAAEVEQLRAIDAWAERTTTGDKSELPFVPTDGVWRLRSTDREDCLGNACPHVEDCFARKAKQRAQDADVIVVNQHVLFAHIALKMECGADVVLPRWDVLILDEAHEAADIARDFFGATITRHAARRAIKWLAPRGDVAVDAALAARLSVAWDALWRAIDAVSIPKGEDTLTLTAPWLPAAVVEAALSAIEQVELLAQLHGRTSAADTEADKIAAKKAANLARRMAKLWVWLDAITRASDPSHVFWLARAERRGESVVQLEARPLDVAQMLREHVWHRSSGAKATVIATSATLTTGRGVDGWAFARRQLGADDAGTCAVESPFDFHKQAVLCVPRGMPHHYEQREAFDAAVGEHLRALVAAAQGRTLGLFTSRRMVTAMRAALGDCGHMVLAQGDQPRTQLVEAFKADASSVLLGTSSLWTGVDVQGDACVAVLIDRVPFPSPSEPVMAALCDRAAVLSGDKAAGFRDEMLPRATLTLRQGVGRLIRSKSDWGAVVICDGRLLSAPWGRKVIGALGLPVQVEGMADVARWFGGGS